MPDATSRTRFARALLLLGLVVCAPVAAQRDAIGRSETLPEQPGPHWFWLSDIILHRTAFFDADQGTLLGSISSGTAGVGFVITPLFSPDHREIFLPETYFSRGVRGERTDVVTIYDARTLQAQAEIPLPPHRAEYFPGNASSALSDDGRLVAVFNLTPATSLSIVDVVDRRAVAEVHTPGCSLVYAAGKRRFLMLCANGGALAVTVDAAGQTTLARTEPFFDPKGDPITEKAVRRGNDWLFVSFAGVLHPVDVSGDAIRFGEPWALLDDADRTASWRIGGQEHLAVHAASGRLYALMHQGGADTHKAPGTEVWVYDLARKQRVQRIPMVNPLVSFIAQQSGLDETRSGRWVRWLLTKTLPHTGVAAITVTQDAKPVLVAAGAMPPTATVHDALTGDVRRDVSEVGLGVSLLGTP